MKTTFLYRLYTSVTAHEDTLSIPHQMQEQLFSEHFGICHINEICEGSDIEDFVAYVKSRRKYPVVAADKSEVK